MKITILTDNANSWIIPYVETIKAGLVEHDLVHIFDKKDIREGDILFLLSCERLISKQVLSLNMNNIVVHPSALPQYRGWSPLAHQILDGLNEIVVSLFEAGESVDSGPIYLQEKIALDGSELNEEIKDRQGKVTTNLVLRYTREREQLKGTTQCGPATYGEKMLASSSEISPKVPIIEQFNQFRVADNDRYPIFFYHKGKKYILKIYEDNQT